MSVNKPDYRMYMSGGIPISESVFRDAEKISAVMTQEQRMILSRVACVLKEIDHCFSSLINNRNCPDLCHQDISGLITELDLRFGMDDYNEHFFQTDAWHVRFGGETLDSIERLYEESEQ